MRKMMFPKMEKVEMTPEMKEKFARIRQRMSEKGTNRSAAFAEFRKRFKKEE